MTQKVLVTGAAGFIGSHVCRHLLEGSYEVTGVDSFDPFYERGIKEIALRELQDYETFDFMEIDVRNQQDIGAALSGVDAVIHLAARAGVRPSIDDPEAYMSLNVIGTTTLLEACRERDVKRFVFGSSSSVYGDDTPVPFTEDAPCSDPISPYAATKRAGELLCRVYAHLHGFRVAALRFFTVYGPRQRPDLAIHRFTRMISDGESIPQFGDGSSERDYTWVDDIVQGVQGALAWTEDARPEYDVFNLGESKTVRLDELITLIGEQLGVKPSVDIQPPRPGDVRRTYADITKARTVLNYRPAVTIQDGIARFVRWYETSRSRL